MTPPERKPSVNPCEAKGRYGGRLAAGRCYVRGASKIVISGCECGKPFLSPADEGVENRQCLAMRIGATEISTVEAPGGKRTAESDFVVVPCAEVFRHFGSVGTKLYRKKAKTPTEFRGCQAVEDELVAASLMRHELIGTLGRNRDALLDAVRQNASGGEMDETFPDLLRAAPQEVVESGVGATMFLELLDAKDPRRKLARERASRFQAFLQTLTAAQREALDLVHLRRDERQTKAEIARALGISVDTLRDRLGQAVKKLEACFPEFQRRPRRRAIDTASDLMLGGFHRKSSARRRTGPVSIPFPRSDAQPLSGPFSGTRDWTRS